MGSQLINLCLIPDHSGCDIFALQLQGLGDHKLYFSTARMGLDLLLHCGCLFCSQGLLQTEESSMILEKKDITLCELFCVTSPEKVVFSSSDVVNTLHEEENTAAGLVRVTTERKLPAMAQVSWEREILAQTTSRFWWRCVNSIPFLLSSANAGI